MFTLSDEDDEGTRCRTKFDYKSAMSFIEEMLMNGSICSYSVITNAGNIDVYVLPTTATDYILIDLIITPNT